MENNVDIQEKECNKILEDPKKDEASPFYWACRNGDVDAVRIFLELIDPDQLKQLEPDGCTALHAAEHNGHTEIVRLLREKGFTRHRQNRYVSASFEEAKTDEIRASFDRPGNLRRFCSDLNKKNGLVLGTLKYECLHDDDDYISGKMVNARLATATSQYEIRQTETLENSMITMVYQQIIAELIFLFLEVCGNL